MSIKRLNSDMITVNISYRYLGINYEAHVDKYANISTLKYIFCNVSCHIKLDPSKYYLCKDNLII